MNWAKVFVVLFVSHVVGDYLLQTDWQAVHKRRGLGSDPVARRALFTHTLSYVMAFVPALIWISATLGWKALILLPVIGVPHLVQDDGRLLSYYARHVKGLDPAEDHAIVALCDQAFHQLALLGAALLVAALA